MNSRRRRFWVECAAIVVIGIPFVAAISLLIEGPLHVRSSDWLRVAIGGAGIGLAKRIASLYFASQAVPDRPSRRG